jgi:hypothetical protein
MESAVSPCTLTLSAVSTAKKSVSLLFVRLICYALIDVPLDPVPTTCIKGLPTSNVIYEACNPVIFINYVFDLKIEA